MFRDVVFFQAILRFILACLKLLKYQHEALLLDI